MTNKKHSSDYSPITFNKWKSLPEVDETPEFPYDYTPKILANWIRDMAEIKSMPPDFIAVPLIVSLATLIAGRTKIQPLRNDPTFLITPNLWGMIIGRPSTLKSPALKLSLKYIEAFEDQLRVENQAHVDKYENKNRAWDQKVKISNEKIKKTLKSSPGMSMDELMDREGIGPKPELPIAKRLVTNDTTTEKLAEVCSQNPEGILVWRDELVGWLKNLDHPNRGNDRAFFNEGWNGNVSYTTDRIGRGTQHIANLTLSVLGGCQPGVLNKYIREAVDNEGGDGLLQRFQLMVYPGVVQEMGNGNFPNEDYQRSINVMFDNFYSFSPNLFDYFLFDEKGQKLYTMFDSELFRKTRAGELGTVQEAHIGKYRSLYSSLALIFTLVEDIGAKEISSQSCINASRWCRYLETHARIVYGLIDDPFAGSRKILANLPGLIDIDKIREIASQTDSEGLRDYRLTLFNPDFVVEHNLYISVRDILNKKWSKLKTSEQISQSLNKLEELGITKEVVVPTKGRNKLIHMVNPKATLLGHWQGFDEEGVKKEKHEEEPNLKRRKVKRAFTEFKHVGDLLVEKDELKVVK